MYIIYLSSFNPFVSWDKRSVDQFTELIKVDSAAEWKELRPESERRLNEIWFIWNASEGNGMPWVGH
jgi:hypothetical protein